MKTVDATACAVVVMAGVESIRPGVHFHILISLLRATACSASVHPPHRFVGQSRRGHATAIAAPPSVSTIHLGATQPHADRSLQGMCGAVMATFSGLIWLRLSQGKIRSFLLLSCAFMPGIKAASESSIGPRGT
ncbi:uncharacterized protein BDR25DRAFT_361850 [Lindgomyces ingoldianus]|uniref:Uncharacterized protein n=1 Tax=Lindgomyces ingoldianus TaxID=673940 RepID=A0ACB6QDA5_9PLEO|nr:uncharacterized protein BDR25DRAFT_361850 [Lindgomyces ingoldianus]KAF2464352.1 hypothetical protein BDR25DRAFT_361850 [Lindgomyces ingoldianus]